jgi:O-Antigen ligase
MNSLLSPALHNPPVSTRQKTDNYIFIGFLLIHLPLGVLLYNAGPFAVIHPLAAFLFGLQRAYRRDISLAQVALPVAYIVGSEVLWRMANASYFWELGKYAAGAIMIVALIRRRSVNPPVLPLIYFLLLMPGCLLTVFMTDFARARSDISFNISGPLLLFISCWFGSHLELNWQQIKRIFFALLIPLGSVATTTFFYTMTTADIQFNTESNYATSGGFGPNQVSAMLGLGVFLCISLYLLAENTFLLNLLCGLLAVVLATQSVMTFSRGGMYNALGSALAVLFVLIRSPQRLVKNGIQIIALIVIFIILIFPYLNNFTGGMLLARFEETETTGRTEIADSDWQIFTENPILGVGAGASFDEREKYLSIHAASHTEFSRLIAEHGIFGAFALICLILIALVNPLYQKSVTGQALTAGLIVWACLFMLNAGMRLAAPAFIFGLSFILIPDSRRTVRIIPFTPKIRNLKRYVAKNSSPKN